MVYNSNIHHRHSVRLHEYDYSWAGLYFTTICVRNKECVFGRVVNEKMILNELGQIANNCWLEIPQHYQKVVLHEFIVMPNHIHGILEITEPLVGVEYFRPDTGTENNTVELKNNLKDNMLKSENNRVENIRPLRERPNCKSGTIGAIIRGFKIGVTKQIGYSVWQRNYHEHIIRNRNNHARIVDYINHNPAQWQTDVLYKN